MPMPRGKRAGSKTPTVDYAAGCLARSTSTKCPTKKSRTSSSPPISRPESAWASRPLSRRSSKSLAKTCKSGSHSPGKADFGAGGYLAVAALVLAIILLVIKFTRGFLQNVAVLIGITVGYLVTIALGWTDFSGIAEEPIVRVVMPLQFGVPQFFLIPSLTMCLVVMIVFIEATGMFLALGAMTGRKVDAEDVKRGLRADSLGTVIGAIFNTFPYVSYSQNIGLVGVTGVYSRWVCVAGGVIMLALGLIPKLAFIVASVPQCVLGGAGFIMFGMVAAN